MLPWFLTTSAITGSLGAVLGGYAIPTYHNQKKSWSWGGAIAGGLGGAAAPFVADMGVRRFPKQFASLTSAINQIPGFR